MDCFFIARFPLMNKTMSEKQNQTSRSSVPLNGQAQEELNPEREAESRFSDGKDAPPGKVSVFLNSTSRKIRNKLDSAIPESKFKRGLKKSWAAIDAFLGSLDAEEEPEPPPPPEKPLKESISEFIERCRDREKRIVMLQEFGEWCWTMFFRGMVFFFLFVLTIWGTIWALDYSDNHRIRFFPPDEIMDYLIAEHEKLEEDASRMTPPAGKTDNIPFDLFDAKFIETVKPIRIYSDKYGIYFMTSKGWYNGEHGIFIAKDEENMPPDINWGLIEGRIYTYAIYD